MTTHKEALEAAYLAGFNASGEGYNGEYPFGDKMQDPAENRMWKKDRDNYIKEALAQPEQEPVAWELGAEVYWGDSPELSDYVRKEGTPLYTTPPQRTWVGLTDADLAGCDEFEYKSACFWEAKLKEKNT